MNTIPIKVRKDRPSASKKCPRCHKNGSIQSSYDRGGRKLVAQKCINEGCGWTWKLEKE